MRIDPRSSPRPSPATPADKAQLEADVAVLTGRKPMGPDGALLPDRASPENRARTREWLKGRLAELGLQAQLHEYASTGKNVYAVIPSTRDPNADYVILGAHFDSVRNCPGADDNATGVASVLAAASELARLPDRAKNVVVVFFDQEEIGLVGSRAFVKFVQSSGWRVDTMHGIDMLGWDKDGDRAIELDRPSKRGIQDLYEQAAKRLGMKIQFEATNTGGSDHVPFQNANFPAVCVSEEWANRDTTPHYHKPTDKAETVDYDYLASSSAVLAEAMKDLVSREKPTEGDRRPLEPMPYTPRSRLRAKVES